MLFYTSFCFRNIANQPQSISCLDKQTDKTKKNRKKLSFFTVLFCLHSNSASIIGFGKVGFRKLIGITL